MLLPFSQLNLRRNPFGELEPDEWASVVVPDLHLSELSEAIEAGGVAVQFLGHCGRGKTSHLRALHARFPNAPYHYFPEDEAMPRTFPDGDVLFLDETQRIPPRIRSRVWKRAFARNGSLVIATHLDHRRELERAGLCVIAHHIQGLSEDKLIAICERRIDLVVRNPNAPVPRIERDHAHALLQRHGDNLRAICDELYDHFQHRLSARLAGTLALQGMTESEGNSGRK